MWIIHECGLYTSFYGIIIIVVVVVVVVVDDIKAATIILGLLDGTQSHSMGRTTTKSNSFS